MAPHIDANGQMFVDAAFRVNLPVAACYDKLHAGIVLALDGCTDPKRVQDGLMGRRHVLQQDLARIKVTSRLFPDCPPTCWIRLGNSTLSMYDLRAGEALFEHGYRQMRGVISIVCDLVAVARRAA